MSLLRSILDWYLSLHIVRYPIFGRLGVWLCNHYETRRYRTSVEDSLVIHRLTTAGPFAPGGVFNVAYSRYTLPPKRYNKPWWGLDDKFYQLLTEARQAAGRDYKYAVSIDGLLLRNRDDSPKGFSSYREAECFTFAVDDFKSTHHDIHTGSRRIRAYVVSYPAEDQR